MKKLLPVLLLLIGVGGGVGAGVMFRPDPAETTAHSPCGDVEKIEKEQHKAHGEENALEQEYIQLNNQFVVPIVSDDAVESLVVLTLGIEVDPGQAEAIYAREPKLRDALLQVLFDHANIGGFRGRFTDGNNMDILRLSLTEAAQSVAGDIVRGVMITDIARQDV